MKKSNSSKSIKRIIKKDGFTLAELLIVVAIIAVLVAVSIPIFTSQLEKTRKATCMANRRGLKSELSAEYMTNPENVVNPDGSVKWTQTDSTHICPDKTAKITVKFENESFVVNCSKHSDGLNAAAMKNLIDYLTADGNPKTLKALDSTSNSADTEAFKKNLLEKTGLDLESLGAKTWKLSKDVNGWLIQWTTEDVTKMNAGDSITIMRYRLPGAYSSQYGDRYSVWSTTVKSNGDYNVISEPNSNKEIAASAKVDVSKKSDFELMKQIYNDYMTKENKEPIP
ncbi:MAG: prepilin-type N-terminal cleavage/methylation domain-containing protein [Lachnospiraceae bacterium]|nr:prepilin-type N-terminal cleavage/methylation domain-containing protein [Lachnospiraceae bacterium]MDD3616118.1 prepilin-type N-terminal cleavage/methylation domain-containing protein [Lachnospiraceae bacterium]